MNKPDFLNQLLLPFLDKIKTGKQPISRKNKQSQSVKQPNLLLKTWRENVVYVWICCVGLCLIIQFCIVPIVHEQALKNHSEMLGSRSTIDIQHAFSTTQQRLKAIAENQMIHEALMNNDTASIENLSKNLSYSFADIESFDIIAWDHLGSVGLKQRNADIRNSIEMMMVTKAEGGTLPAPEVYREGDKWRIILVAPVLNNNTTIGFLLLRLNKQYLSGIINQQNYTDAAQLTIKHKGRQFIVKYGNPTGTTLKNTYPLPFSNGIIEIETNTIQSKEVGISFFLVYGLVMLIALLLTIFSFLAYLNNIKVIKQDIKTIQHYMDYINGINRTRQPRLFFTSLYPILSTADMLANRLGNQKPINIDFVDEDDQMDSGDDSVNDDDVISDDGIIKNNN